jgi:hypothetical protein
MVIAVIASGAFPYPRYGCPNHRRRGVCEKKLTIPQRQLEQQLIGAITKQLLDPRLEKERTQEFMKQLNVILEQEAKLARDAASKSSELKEQRATTRKEADNFIAAIRQHGLSPLLSAELSKVETRLAELDRTMDRTPAGQTPTFSTQQINEFLKRKSRAFADVLSGDPTRAKQKLQKHITKLVLTRTETPDGNVFEVSGDVALFVGGTDDVMVTNSLERIAQHYTSLSLSGVVLDPRFEIGIAL